MAQVGGGGRCGHQGDTKPTPGPAGGIGPHTGTWVCGGASGSGGHSPWHQSGAGLLVLGAHRTPRSSAVGQASHGGHSLPPCRGQRAAGQPGLQVRAPPLPLQGLRAQRLLLPRRQVRASRLRGPRGSLCCALCWQPSQFLNPVIPQVQAPAPPAPGWWAHGLQTLGL